MDTMNFLAFDLGATSGRTILGSLSDKGLALKELTRFPNNIRKIGSHYYWNIFSLYENLLEGLKAAAKEGAEISSIGIDTWGVDMVCIGKDGSILGLPYSYRDPHTENAPEEFFGNVMSRKELYGATGIQIMNFNSVFQLYAMKRDKSSALEAAGRILFMPDALSYMLTGNMVTEYTIASTSQFINPYTRQPDTDILEKTGISPALFGKVTMPGETVGILKDDIADECGLRHGIPVIAVAGHDTGSAVAAVPATEKGFAYLSSGTWSLMGIETREPVINDGTFAANITNEGGVDGTIRLLKNITGMWIMENCMKEWKKQGCDYTYPQIVEMAGSKPAFRSFIDPDHKLFANPQSMTGAIEEYCRMTSQPVPQTHSDFVACIFESLALKYRAVIEIFRKFSPEELTVLHIIGGGSRNDLLNKYAANATGLKTVAGPAEATAIGNIMIQARAAGLCDTLESMRKTTVKSIETETFFPTSSEEWEKAYERFTALLK